MRVTALVRRFALIPAVAVALLAVSLVPVVSTPEARAAGCVVGRWESTDIETYLRSVLSAGDAFTVVGVSGTQSYQFNDDGSFVNTFNDVVVRSESSVGVMTMRMTGTITGNYREDGDYLRFSGVSGDIQAAIAINDQPLPAATPVPGLIGDGGAPARFTCTGDILTLAPEIPDRAVAPQVYARQ